MLRRLASSMIVRLIAAIFVVQVFSGAAAILLLRTKMLQVIAADQTRQIADVRDDLVTAFYRDGYQGLVRYVGERRGSVADPLILVGVSSGGKPAVFSHLVAMPAVPAGLMPVEARVYHASGQAPVEALVLATDLADGTHLVVGSLTAPDRRFDLAFAEALALVVVLTVLLAFAGALVIGYVVSRRAHAIAETAEALASGNFAARVPGNEHGDGFDHLRRQMNFMAERIDSLIHELQSVAGALAHDLRSPVARLRAAIETAQQAIPDGAVVQPGQQEVVQQALQLALSDADALEGMLGTALELSRIESGTTVARRQDLDLADVANDLAELYEPLAEQSDRILVAETLSAPLRGDRELLSRALANLIDNALKYGGHNIVVRTGRSDDDQGLFLEVEDDGPGIALQDRERAVGRFIRLDNARTRPGAGLGLAMVAAVARLHGGALELRSGELGSGGDSLIDDGPGPGGLVARMVLRAD